MKILAVGDIHLGRTPSRLPSELAERAKEFGPAEAWRRSVDKALECGVRAVLLAGDVVEREDDFFEAYRELSSGVERLTEKGVEVIGVAGNHDVKVLPRLANQIPSFRLLGAGGEWQPHSIAEKDERVCIWGWSFPQRAVTGSPLPGVPFDRKPGINLGLLHCDRDGGSSPYAPVNTSELNHAGLDGWLLGHIHKPDNLTADSLSGYLGSVSGLDPGEPGQHGPWLIKVESARVARVEQIPLAPLRWETLTVDLSELGSAVEAKDRLLTQTRWLDESVSVSAGASNAVGLRVVLAGRTRFGASARAEIDSEDREDVYRGSGNRRYFIETIVSDTRPEIDLGELARRADPPGLLARRLLWLEEPEGHHERDRLVALARGRLEGLVNDPVWNDLHDEGALEPNPVERLREAGFRALEQLLTQTPELG
ncbi:MAG: metallophosphoesterase [Gammaproteobacteria bacterium]|nr:metallophosphoesterase [Gammaproteobacteria bacterium]MDE0367775.1 metallophosphoesterase [Gammaproteobacteria bacterium]